MTEQDFLRQVWRPYDTVEIDGGMKGRVTSVCFPTRSVRATINKEVHDWFRCEMIVSHTSAGGETDDLEMIANLHDKLMKAIDANEKKDKCIKALQEKLDSNPNQAELQKLRKALNRISDATNSIESKMTQIDAYLEKLGVTEEEV